MPGSDDGGDGAGRHALAGEVADDLLALVAGEAQRLLSRTSLTGAQIATSLSFDDPSYFSRFFRRETGVTPSAYRQSMHATAA